MSAFPAKSACSWWLRLAAVMLALVLGGMATTARAQIAGQPGATSSVSTTETVVFNPATTTNLTSTSYSTQVLGRLNGGTIYDQMFAVAVGDPAVQTAFGTAATAITVAGGPGVVIGSPHIVSSTTTTSSTTTSIFSLVGSSSVTTAEIVVGATGVSTVIGPRSVCDVSGLPGATAPTCGTAPSTLTIANCFHYGAAISGGDCHGPAQLTVIAGEVNTNTNVETTYTIDQANTVTTTTLLSEVWAVDGIAQKLGVVHTAVRSGAFDAAARLLRRMGDEAGDGADGPNGWAEFYGTAASDSGDNTTPGERRVARGFSGGFEAALTEQLVLGFGIDWSRTGIELDSASAESGALDLTELGGTAAWHSGAIFAKAAASFGFGDAETSHAVGGMSTASYGLGTWGVLGETGTLLDLGGFTLTPSLGFDFTGVRSDGFTETGGLALSAASYSAARTRAWLGLGIAGTWQTATGGALDFSAQGRLVGVLSGGDRLLPVSYASSPGAAPMTATGNAESGLGLELGTKLSYAVDNRLTLSAAWDGRFAEGFSSSLARLGLKMQF